jgi:dihydroorotase
LRRGNVADVTVFDPDAEWTVDPSRFRSKGRNTPYAGKTLKGRVHQTIVDGRVIYRHDG